MIWIGVADQNKVETRHLGRLDWMRGEQTESEFTAIGGARLERDSRIDRDERPARVDQETSAAKPPERRRVGRAERLWPDRDGGRRGGVFQASTSSANLSKRVAF